MEHDRYPELHLAGFHKHKSKAGYVAHEATVITLQAATVVGTALSVLNSTAPCHPRDLAQLAALMTAALIVERYGVGLLWQILHLP